MGYAVATIEIKEGIPSKPVQIKLKYTAPILKLMNVNSFIFIL
jgi:hypothetical protein